MGCCKLVVGLCNLFYYIDIGCIGILVFCFIVFKIVSIFYVVRVCKIKMYDICE